MDYLIKIKWFAWLKSQFGLIPPDYNQVVYLIKPMFLHHSTIGSKGHQSGSNHPFHQVEILIKLWIPLVIIRLTTWLKNPPGGLPSGFWNSYVKTR